MPDGVVHQPLHLLGGVRVHHHVGDVLDLLVAQPQQVVAGAAVGHRQPGVVPGGDKVLPHDLPQRRHVLRGDLGGVVRQVHLVEADVVGVVPEVVVRHLEGLLHQLVEGLLGVLEKLRVAPAENGAVAPLRRGGLQPVGPKALVRFAAHSASLLFVI